jgi:hypothetical protein
MTNGACRGIAHVQVEAMKRRDLYQRNRLLQKIQDEAERAFEVLAQRTSLQEQRKLANMSASFQRQKLMQVLFALHDTVAVLIDCRGYAVDGALPYTKKYCSKHLSNHCRSKSLCFV